MTPTPDMTDAPATATQTPSQAARLTPATLFWLAVWGANFWLQGLLIVRFAAEWGVFTAGWRHIAWFAVTPMLAIAAAELSTRMLKTPPVLFLRAVTIMCVTALGLDAIVLTWWAGFYHADASIVAGAGAWLLWGVACALGYALVKPSGKAATKQAALEA